LLAASCASPEVVGYKATNPHPEDILGKAIVIEREAVEPFIHGALTTDSKLLVTDDLGRVAVSQCDDLNGDGQWDELVLLADFEANQTLTFSFKQVAASEMPAFQKRTNIRFGHKNAPFYEVVNEPRLKSVDSPTISAVYQMEGPAWENDLVGFRNYYDARNGMDIFGKTVNEMVLDSAGIREQNYHLLDKWGMDILKVGNSLGAGAIAIGVGQSLYRVGPSEMGSYRLICEGPVRSMFELLYTGVPAGDRFYDVVHRISIYAGDHFYRSEVWVKNLMGDEFLYTGIVDMHNLPAIEMEVAGVKISGTHGNQAFGGEILGLGLLVPVSQYLLYKSAPLSGDGIVQTHMAGILLQENAPARYAFFAGWELQDTSFVSEEYFRARLSQAAMKMDEVGW
jgi:hypothetical protein